MSAAWLVLLAPAVAYVVAANIYGVYLLAARAETPR